MILNVNKFQSEKLKTINLMKYIHNFSIITGRIVLYIYEKVYKIESKIEGFKFTYL